MAFGRDSLLVSSVEKLMQTSRKDAPELAGLASAQAVSLLQRRAKEAMETIAQEGVVTTRTAEAVCALSTCCLLLAEEAGLSSPSVAALVCEGLAAAYSVFESSRPSECVSLLEPLGEIMDGFAIEIFVGLLRLEECLRPRWSWVAAGDGGCLVLDALQAARDAENDDIANGQTSDSLGIHVRLYQALQGVCMWSLAMAVRSVGDHTFTPRHLWEFASRGALGAAVFVKQALSFNQWICGNTFLDGPADIVQLRDQIIAALLGLVGQDVAFASCVDSEDAEINITIRNATLRRHHALLGASVVHCDLLDCLLSYPWAQAPTGISRVPALATFVASLTKASGVREMEADMEALLCRLNLRSDELWHILASHAVPSRGYLRDCSILAHSVSPPATACDLLFHRCLSEVRLEDSLALAALIALAANARLQPGGDALTRACACLGAEERSQLVARLEQWGEPLQEEALTPWLGEVSIPPIADHLGGNISIVREDIVSAAPNLRQILDGVPEELCCALDRRMLVDPVRTPAGFVFERGVLSRELDRNGGICPLSGTQLSLAQCERDPQVRFAVLSWVRQNRSRRQI